MLIERIIISCLLLSNVFYAYKVASLETETKVRDEENSGSGDIMQDEFESQGMTNRSRKDYIVAIEKEAPLERNFDPIFQMLSKLAKRSHGKLAVMDYGNNEPQFDYDDNESNDDNDTPYEEDYDNDDSEQFHGKKSLIGPDILANFLGMQRFGMQEDRGRERDESRFLDNNDEYFDQNDDDYSPSMVYEMEDDDQNEIPYRNPGNRRAYFSDNNDDGKKKK